MTDQQESTDVLGAPYTARTLPLRPDDEGEVVATLVSRRAAPPTNRAVLHVHGFADYFFQTVAGHLLGGVEGDVLERAFEYWKSVDADTGKKIEELVREGIDAGAPGAQPGEAKEDASSPVVEDATHASS